MRGRATPSGLADLTDTQRQVLARIAAGQTNYAIASDLGMTLDGAKYHVSEILNKLGVNSREDAAEAWRRSQRTPGARLFAWPMAKWVGIGAAGIGVVAAGLWLITSLASDKDEESDGFRVAYLVGGDTSASDPRSVVIVNDDGTTRSLDPEMPYAGVEWSPDGRYLSALEATDQIRMRVFESASGTSWRWNLGPLWAFKWSPNGEYLAVLATTDVSIRRPDGSVVVSFALQSDENEGMAAPPLLWSPDSRRVAASFDGDAVVLEVDGRSTVLSRPADFSPAHILLSAWQTPTELVIADTGRPHAGKPSLPGAVADIRDSPPVWQPATHEFIYIDAYDRQQAEAFMPGFESEGVCPTADGGGYAWAFSPAGDPTRVTLLVVVDGNYRRFELPEPMSEPLTQPRRCISVVLEQ